MAPPPDGNLCNYSVFRCHGERIAGFEYCVRHILSDKSAPFRPCTFCPDLEKPVVRCGKPAPYYDRAESLCAEHSRAVQSTVRHQPNNKRKAVETILLDSLAHYKKQRVSPDTDNSSSRVDPFRLKEESENEGLALLAIEAENTPEEAETSGSETMIVDTWRGEGDSDGDSADSEAEDCLQHAGVYTAEEVMRTMKDKLVKLQKLYKDQFQRIVHKMRESRRLYLSQLKAEKEAGLTNIFNQPKERQEYERLKAMIHYNSPTGREALLANKHRERRLATLPGNKPPSYPRCQHNLTTTTKCSAQCVPMTKYCLKHILEEPGQVLYKSCGAVTPADGPCETPIPTILNNATCVFHTKLQPPTSPPKVKPPEPKTSAEETTKQKGKSGKNRDKKSGKVKKTKDSKSVSKKCGSKGKAAKSNADKEKPVALTPIREEKNSADKKGEREEGLEAMNEAGRPESKATSSKSFKSNVQETKLDEAKDNVSTDKEMSNKKEDDETEDVDVINIEKPSIEADDLPDKKAKEDIADDAKTVEGDDEAMDVDIEAGEDAGSNVKQEKPVSEVTSVMQSEDETGENQIICQDKITDDPQDQKEKCDKMEEKEEQADEKTCEENSTGKEDKKENVEDEKTDVKYNKEKAREVDEKEAAVATEGKEAITDGRESVTESTDVDIDKEPSCVEGDKSEEEVSNADEKAHLAS